MASAGVQQPAQGQSQSALFGQAITGLLKQFQQIPPQPYLPQQFAAQEQQINRASFTPPSLIGASPSVQASARGASVAALQPTIQGARQANQTFSGQLSQFGNVIGVASNLYGAARQEESQRDQLLRQEQERHETQLNELRLNVISGGGDSSLIDSRYSYAENLRRVEPFLRNTAQQQERQTQIVNIGGNEVLVDKQTGEVIKIIGPAAPRFYVDPYTGQLVQMGGGEGGGTGAGRFGFGGDGASSSLVYNWSPTPDRTDRNNNPIAVTTAPQYTNALARAGINWSQGDPFQGSDGQTYYTVRFSDPEAGREGARTILSDPSGRALSAWYANHTGAEVLRKYGIMSEQQFAQAPREIQDTIIDGIYQKEQDRQYGYRPSWGVKMASAAPGRPESFGQSPPSAPTPDALTSQQPTQPPVSVSEASASQQPAQLPPEVETRVLYKIAEKQGLLHPIAESGAPDEFLGAMADGFIAFEDGKFFWNVAAGLRDAGTITPEQANETALRVVNEGNAKAFGDSLLALVGVTGDDITNVMISAGLDQVEAVKLAAIDKVRFQLALKNVTKYELKTRQATGDVLAEIFSLDAPMALKQKRIEQLRTVFPAYPGQLNDIAQFALQPRTLSQKEREDFGAALDSFLQEVYGSPQDVTVSGVISIPVLGGGSRTSGVNIGEFRFSTASNESLEEGGNESWRRYYYSKIAPFLGSSREEKTGAALGAATLGGLGLSVGGPLGAVPAAIGGALLGSRATPVATKVLETVVGKPASIVGERFGTNIKRTRNLFGL